MSDPFDCPHGMGKATSCVTCMEDGPVAPAPERLTSEFWLTHAQFESACGRCAGDIHVGESIGKHSDFGWCCNKCVKEPQS